MDDTWDLGWSVFQMAISSGFHSADDIKPELMNRNIPPFGFIIHRAYVTVFGQLVMFGLPTEDG